MSISVAPFTYFGGKTRMAGDIIALFPPHRVYIEPFFGSVTVCLHVGADAARRTAAAGSIQGEPGVQFGGRS